MKDWSDIERVAFNEPVLHAAVTRVGQGVSREEALIAAVISLAEQVSMLRRAKFDALYFGNGFVHVTRDNDGEFRYVRIDPVSVTIRTPAHETSALDRT